MQTNKPSAFYRICQTLVKKYLKSGVGLIDILPATNLQDLMSAVKAILRYYTGFEEKNQTKITCLTIRASEQTIYSDEIARQDITDDAYNVSFFSLAEYD